jgi:hypothetical protein
LKQQADGFTEELNTLRQETNQANEAVNEKLEGLA